MNVRMEGEGSAKIRIRAGRTVPKPSLELNNGLIQSTAW